MQTPCLDMLRGAPHAGSSSQLLAYDFPDQARDDVALGLFGCLQHLVLLGGQVKLDRFLHERAQLVRLDPGLSPIIARAPSPLAPGSQARARHQRRAGWRSPSLVVVWLIFGPIISIGDLIEVARRLASGRDKAINEFIDAVGDLGTVGCEFSD